MCVREGEHICVIKGEFVCEGEIEGKGVREVQGRGGKSVFVHTCVLLSGGGCMSVCLWGVCERGVVCVRD